jgi:hypothetical protein
MKSPRRSIRLSVYDGQELCGYVQQLTPQRFEALDPHGRVLGIYRNQRAAAQVLPNTVKEEIHHD